MTAPRSVRKFFKKVLQQVYNFNVDVIVGDANAAAYQDLHNSSVAVMLTIRDFSLPPDMLAMRTAGPKWNHAKLYGFFAALWFLLMENGEDQKGESESLPEWPSLCGNLRQRFDDLCIIVKWGAQKEHNHS